MAMVVTERLAKIYGRGENAVEALRGVDLTVEAGEFVAIVGTSGSGKSTLLHMLGGLDRPTEGRIVVSGQDLSALTDEKLAIFRRRSVGFVFQNYNLIPILNVRENITLPVELDGSAPDERHVGELLHALGLESKAHSLPGQLSGGQQQRVAIARALAAKPAIVLADEPTGNLDSRTSQEVLILMKRLAERYRQTTIMITHNEEIAQTADRMIRIEDGRIAVRTAAGGR
ncbi:ABC transporter ATP-binding protein [Paenibacillus spiritus]|uniref:ABC transporter ATP-binding protein n=1 Tax=Paenibacillus spiritus TaxID=2496557 RepID=A0A5J5GCE0_9BACL|nr:MULTISPECIES: ABC transporter ATP-binding protein [Paenibacillus]KAA9005825.1 ABC transporter ATP-binding protein [Paenibacillus spiritus]